jgi:hypothetical protein
VSHLKDKSDQNIASAQYLIVKSHYASSVHCSYYSCVQLMLHILGSHFKKTEIDIDNESQLGSKDEGGFHNWLINYIQRQFFLINNKDSREFYTFIGQLKNQRVRSDYRNVEIKPQKATESKSYAEEIIKLLNKNFTI